MRSQLRVSVVGAVFACHACLVLANPSDERDFAHWSQLKGELHVVAADPLVGAGLGESKTSNGITVRDVRVLRLRPAEAADLAAAFCGQTWMLSGGAWYATATVRSNDGEAIARALLALDAAYDATNVPSLVPLLQRHGKGRWHRTAMLLLQHRLPGTLDQGLQSDLGAVILHRHGETAQARRIWRKLAAESDPASLASRSAACWLAATD